MQNNSCNFRDSDASYAEQSSGEQSPPRNNTLEILISMELCGTPAREHIIISCVPPSEPQNFTKHSDFNDPTVPWGYGRQGTITLPPASSNGLSLPPNPFNILATMAVVPPTVRQYNDGGSPPSSVPSELSSISMPPMTTSTVDTWETSSDVGTL